MCYHKSPRGPLQEVHEVAVLRHKDNIRLSGGVEDLVIFGIPETQVSDRNSFELESPREPDR